MDESQSNLLRRMAAPPPDGTLALWWLGQMGVALQHGTVLLYVDPWLTGDEGVVKGRTSPPPLNPHAVTNAAFVLITHEHPDHLDEGTLVPLLRASPAARVVANGWCALYLKALGIAEERIVPAAPLESLALADGLTVTPVPSAHPTVEIDSHKGCRWLGYHVHWQGVSVYHSGDTVMYHGLLDALRALPPVDAAVVAANGRDTVREGRGLVGNLHPREAGWLAQALGWRLLIPGHNDLLPGNSLSEAEVTAGIQAFAPAQPYKLMRLGERLLVSAES